MLSRNPNRLEEGQYQANFMPIPEEWLQRFHGALVETYAIDLTATKRKFSVFGEIYKDEVCLGLCLHSEEVESLVPVSYIVSAELNDKIQPLELLETLVDSSEFFFDQFFANESTFEYEVDWKESEYRGQKFYYITSRENLALTKMANDLLSQNF